MAIKDKKRGYITLNGDDKTAIEEAVKNAVKFSEASPQDEAYNIAEFQLAETFDNGVQEPDLDRGI